MYRHRKDGEAGPVVRYIMKQHSEMGGYYCGVEYTCIALWKYVRKEIRAGNIIQGKTRNRGGFIDKCTKADRAMGISIQGRSYLATWRFLRAERAKRKSEPEQEYDIPSYPVTLNELIILLNSYGINKENNSEVYEKITSGWKPSLSLFAASWELILQRKGYTKT